MQLIVQILVEIIFITAIQVSGIFTRWLLKSAFDVIRRKPVTPYKKYSDKLSRERDPSNLLVDGVINFGLGFGVLFGIGWLLIALLKTIS